MHFASGRAAWIAEWSTNPATLTPKFVVPGSTKLPWKCSKNGNEIAPFLCQRHPTSEWVVHYQRVHIIGFSFHALLSSSHDYFVNLNQAVHDGSQVHIAHLHIDFDQRRGSYFAVQETERVQEEMLLFLAHSNLFQNSKTNEQLTFE